MMKDATIAIAAGVLQQFPSENDEQICLRLIDAGIPAESSPRLLEFLPIAYCRVLLVGLGVRFSNEFQRIQADGSLSSARLLTSEPLWNPVMEFVNRQLQEGIPKHLLLRIAGRSAEFDAVNQLLNRGSNPTHVALTPVIFTHPPMT